MLVLWKQQMNPALAAPHANAQLNRTVVAAAGQTTR